MSAAGSDRRRGAAGFTLIELLVVMAGLALMAGIVAPWYAGAADAVRFRTAMRGLAADLGEARGRALRGGDAVAVGFDATARAYGLPGRGPWITLPPELALAWSDGPLARDAGVLVFFPDGSSSGGSLSVLGPRYAAVIEVDALTGRFATAQGRR